MTCDRQNRDTTFNPVSRLPHTYNRLLIELKMSSYGCTMFPGLHSFNHDAFMLWAAKSYRLACARESGVGAGPIELNMGEGWMSLETISNTSFQMRVRRHTTNGEIAFKLLYKDTHEWKGYLLPATEKSKIY